MSSNVCVRTELAKIINWWWGEASPRTNSGSGLLREAGAKKLLPEVKGETEKKWAIRQHMLKAKFLGPSVAPRLTP